jgi:hypothetical protein
MNKEHFIALVKNPALLKAEDAPFLEEILREFPYFQTAHLLAARCYKITDSIHLQKQIKIAAAHITNRSVLYHLIENFKASENVEEVSAIKGIEETNTNQVQKNTDSDSFVKAESAFQVDNENPIQDVLVELPINKEESSLEPSQPIQVNFENKPNQEIEPPSIHSSTENAHENLIAEKDSLELQLENEFKLAIAESQFIKEFEQNESKIGRNESKSIENEENIDKIAGKEPQVDEILPENIQTSANVEVPTNFVTWLKNLNTGAHLEPKKDTVGVVKDEDKIIEAFMEKPVTRAKAIKQDFYNPVNMAKLSVTDNDFFVTETLAKIYIKQGNLAKAIKVYQNLSLKNPEKNTIFAAQIKILKEQLHNKTAK